MNINIIKNDYFNYHKFIYDNMIKLKLTTTQAMILIYLIDNYIKNDNQLNVSNIVSDLKIDKSVVVSDLEYLVNNEFYNMYMDYQNNIGIEKYNISLFLDKIDNIFNDSNDIKNDVISLIEENVNRLLSPRDYELINIQIIKKEYKYDDVLNVIQMMKKNKYALSVKNIIKYLDTTELNTNKTNPALDKLVKKLGI